MKNKLNLKKSLATILVSLFCISLLPTNILVSAEEVTEVTEENNVELKESEKVNVQILATTDLHGRFTNYEYARDLQSDGGLTQIATLIKENKNGNTVIIDNGDTTQGNYNHLFLNDDMSPMILGLNEIGYDVFNLGNHEFNFGMNKLNDFINQTNDNLNVLCANHIRI